MFTFFVLMFLSLKTYYPLQWFLLVTKACRKLEVLNGFFSSVVSQKHKEPINKERDLKCTCSSYLISVAIKRSRIGLNMHRMVDQADINVIS